MLADHIEAHVFKELQVIDHGLTVRWSVKSIWPVPLIQGTKDEAEVSVQ